MTLPEVLEKEREILQKKIDAADDMQAELEQRLELIGLIADTGNAIDWEKIYSCIKSLVSR